MTVTKTVKACAIRGRPYGDKTRQRLEVSWGGLTTNTLTTVEKDNVIMENECRVRRLTPKECWRLMAFDDADYEKAKAAGVSDTQLYRQAGNSICVDVLCAILKKMCA